MPNTDILMLDYTILTWMHSRSLGFNEHKELCKKQKLMLQEAYFATRKKSNKRVRLSSKDILLKNSAKCRRKIFSLSYYFKEGLI